MSKCYDRVPFSTTFHEKLSAKMTVILDEFSSMGWLGDSTQLELTKVDHTPQVLV